MAFLIKIKIQHRLKLMTDNLTLQVVKSLLLRICIMPGVNIPIHDFNEESVKDVSVRYIDLPSREQPDDAVAHRHNYYEVFFFKIGGGTHIIDFVEHLILDNSLHFVYPGQIHVMKRRPASSGAVVHFSEETGQFAEGMFRLYDASVVTLTDLPPGQSGVTEILMLLRSEYERLKPSSEMLKALLNVLLIRCEEIANSRSGHQPPVPGIFSGFRKLAETYFREQKSPEFYAAELNVTTRTLNSCCKIGVGKTTADYLKNRVLLEAKRLLSNSSLTVKEIAFYLGYDDPSYFNRFFRKNEGISAGDFRTGVQPRSKVL